MPTMYVRAAHRLSASAAASVFIPLSDELLEYYIRSQMLFWLQGSYIEL